MKQKKHALSLLTVALITSVSILITSPTLCAAAPAWPPDIQDDKLDPEVSETANHYLVKRAGDACIAAYTADQTYTVTGSTETYRTGTAWAYYSLGSEGTELLPSLKSTSTNIAGVAQFMYGDFHDCNISDLMRLGGSVSQNYLLDYVKAHASDVGRCNGDTPSGTRDGCTNTTRWILLTNSGTPLDDDDQTAEQLREMLNRTDYDNIYLRGSYISQIASGGVIGGAPQMDKVSWYLVWSHALSQCGEVKAGYPVDSYGEGKAISIDWVSGDNADNEYKKIDAALVFNDGVDASTRVPVWPERSETCENIAKEVSNNTDAYIEAINKHLAETGDEVTEGDMEMDTSTVEEEEDPCQAGFLGFGWLFCPGANLIERFMNGFLNWIDDQLNWTMLAENDGAIRERWQDFLNIANIAFAIAFLVMIYSMATSTGLSNYDIKKMLPRLIVVAIAVNLSFYICAAIVDIFNIVGNGIYGIIVPGGDRWAVSDVDLLFDLFSNVVALIGVLFIFGISAIVALVVIFVCLCVREIALITLVVISPLAFVCYLLPNTQKWFQRWADYFIRLLMVYPMFMAVWGAAKWVASLKGDVTTGSDDAMPGFVVNFTCMIAPAIAIIPLFKMSGGIMGMAASRAAGSKLAARGQAAQGYMRNRGKQAYHNSMIGRGIDRHRERAKDLDKQVNEGSYAGYNPLRRARQAINRGIYSRIGAKGTSSDKDLGSFLKNYTYVDGFGNIQHLTDDQMLNYIQGRAAEDNDGNVILAAQNLNAEQIGSGIKALSGNALEDVSGKTTTGGAPVAATDASKRYAHLQATSYMHEMYAKHGIDIGKGNPSDAYKQLSDLATSGSYVDKSGTKHTFGLHSPVQSDAAEMKRRFDANAGSVNAEKIFNEEAKSFQTKRQSSAIKTTISGFTDAAAKRESDEISQALGSAMKAREFKKNAFKSGTSTPPSP